MAFDRAALAKLWRPKFLSISGIRTENRGLVGPSQTPAFHKWQETGKEIPRIREMLDGPWARPVESPTAGLWSPLSGG
jgi:hypothetical protein